MHACLRMETRMAEKQKTPLSLQKTLFSILYINALVLLTRNCDFVNGFLRITDASFLVDRRKGLIFAFVNGKWKMEN